MNDRNKHLEISKECRVRANTDVMKWPISGFHLQGLRHLKHTAASEILLKRKQLFSDTNSKVIIIIIIINYVAISGDMNVTNKEDEEILKYKDLTIEIQRM
jgi:hypothetical protein